MFPENKSTPNDTTSEAALKRKYKKKRNKKNKDEKNPPPWKTEEIMDLLQQKERLLKKYKATGNKADFEAYRKVRNATTGKVRREKKKFDEVEDEKDKPNAKEEFETRQLKPKKTKMEVKDNKTEVINSGNEEKVITVDTDKKNFYSDKKRFFEKPSEHSFNSRNKFT